jgi:plastocyanin
MTTEITHLRSAGLGCILLGVLLWGAVSAANASGVQRVELRDDCDATTFNQAIGPGICVGSGHTTFRAFIAELTEAQTAAAWRNSPDAVGIEVGTPLVVTNRGGETHTFSCVSTFGGGIVPILNQLSGSATPAVPCAPGEDLHFVAAGTTLDSSISLAPGIYKFQCFIHPWMRTVVTVKKS